MTRSLKVGYILRLIANGETKTPLSQVMILNPKGINMGCWNKTETYEGIHIVGRNQPMWKILRSRDYLQERNVGSC